MRPEVIISSAPLFNQYPSFGTGAVMPAQVFLDILLGCGVLPVGIAGSRGQQSTGDVLYDFNDGMVIVGVEVLVHIYTGANRKPMETVTSVTAMVYVATQYTPFVPIRSTCGDVRLASDPYRWCNYWEQVSKVCCHSGADKSVMPVTPAKHM